MENQRKKFDPEDPKLVAEHLIRFFTTVLKHPTPCRLEKTIPSESVFVTGIFFINAHLLYTYPKYRYSNYLNQRMGSWLNQYVNEKKMIRGVWRERQWVTFHLMKDLLLKWFQNALHTGCSGFDVVLSWALPLVMMVALDSRVGDILPHDRVHADAGLYMTLGDIHLKLEGNDLDVSNVVAKVIIRFEKGHKYTSPRP